ncbi:response regulator [Glaciecola sp. MF2-115]|uniref:response regulator n=1 Tax=Glaciecola sp. MF2-115 TaxID=3384827 RepID=UPI0039A20BA0
MEDPATLLKKMNILVADDMDSMLGLITTCLRELGAENIFTATNGQNAWKLLNRKAIDLIICDWDMPELTGLQLLNFVRESDMHKHIPFLLLTASTEKARVLEAVKAGVDDYLAKPFQPKELDYRVIKLLRKVDLTKGH